MTKYDEIEISLNALKDSPDDTAPDKASLAFLKFAEMIDEHHYQFTSFQKYRTLWAFWRDWYDGGANLPKRVLYYNRMLYINSRDEFDPPHITPDVWQWLQAAAKDNLRFNNGQLDPEERSHLQSIVDGDVPFNHKIK